VTKKSIGRSIKNIASQTCMPTLKNILWSDVIENGFEFW
jgi:hypothetical protein